MKYTVQRGDTLWLIAQRFGVGLEELIAANPQIADPDYIQVGLIIEIPRHNNEYVVKKGDTLWLIAKRFGIGLDELIAANPQIVDPNRINVGDVIYLPMGPEEEPPVVPREPIHIQFSTNLENMTNMLNLPNAKNMMNTPAMPNGAGMMNQANPAHATNMSDMAALAQDEMPGFSSAPQDTLMANGPTVSAPVQHNNTLKNQLQYVVKTGDTLYKIGKKYGVPLAKLIAVNQHIENPDLIMPGNKVIIPVPAAPGMATPGAMKGKDTSPLVETIPAPMPQMPAKVMPVQPMPPIQSMPMPDYALDMAPMDMWADFMPVMPVPMQDWTMTCPEITSSSCQEIIEMLEMMHMNQIDQIMHMMEMMHMNHAEQMMHMMEMMEMKQHVPQISSYHMMMPAEEIHEAPQPCANEPEKKECKPSPKKSCKPCKPCKPCSRKRSI